MSVFAATATTTTSTSTHNAGNFRGLSYMVAVDNGEFDRQGLMRRRFASINDLPINEADHKFRWSLGRRPDDHTDLTKLGL